MTSSDDPIPHTPPTPNRAEVAFYCEHKHKCKWQGFALHQGLGWGNPPPASHPWRKWHDQECGGQLKSLGVIDAR